VSRDRGAAPRTLDGPAQRLTVIVGESDLVGHRPVYSEIVHRAHAAGLAGAAVFRGIEGFGASRQIHTNRLLSLSEDLPVSVVVVDTPERIEAFLPEVEELVTEGLVIVDDVRVVRHVARQPEA
jgi:PII-like signaling protein